MVAQRGECVVPAEHDVLGVGDLVREEGVEDLGDIREIQGRYRGDVREMYGRYMEDVREVYGRCREDGVEDLGPPVPRELHLGRLRLG